MVFFKNLRRGGLPKKMCFVLEVAVIRIIVYWRCKALNPKPLLMERSISSKDESTSRLAISVKLDVRV